MITAELAPDVSVKYSGLPELRSTSPYLIRSHGVTIDVLSDGTVTTSSVTVYRHQGAKGSATLVIPRRATGGAKGEPLPFDIVATWDNKPLKLQSFGSDANKEKFDLSAIVPLSAAGTHALRIRYTTPVGLAGAGQIQRLVAYGLYGNHSIDLLSIAFRYSAVSVFGLPSVSPKLGWETGYTGSAVRIENYNPSNEVAAIQFYPGGFSKIEH